MMTSRQKFMYLFYPLLRFFNSGRNDIRVSTQSARYSIYELNIVTNSGEIISLSAFKGKKLLLVNIASGCGYTRQIEGVNELSKRYPNLQVIAFPSNDFKDQEPLSDEQIQEFCRLNYDVGFPVAKKSSVIKSHEQHEVFRWLTSSELNGWNNHSPEWNFSKYLISGSGDLIAVTGPATDPLSEKFQSLIR